ncbi:MAG: hypothetical protein HPM95_12475 [Alphaproteobacteria bacterium]|nr:hypothetical protein [Alphaproteobacteria bacterium]
MRDTALAGLVALVGDADDSTAVLYDGKGAIVDMAGPLDAPVSIPSPPACAAPNMRRCARS